MGEPTVSAGYAKALFDLAVSKGADRGGLLSAAGLTSDQFDDPDARLPFATFKTLMRAGKELSGDPALALLFGSSISFEKLSIVGLVAYSSESMLDAFQQMNRYGRLVIEVEGVGDDDRFKIVRRNGEVWIEDTRKNPNDFPELTESTLGRFICGHNRFQPDNPAYLAAEVTHDAPAYADIYEQLLGVPVVFGAPRNAMQLKESWLTMRLATQRPYVFGVLAKHADELLAELKASKTVRSAVEARLIPILHKGEASMETIAREMGRSRQTLYRQLKAEGVGYETLLDELRHRMAIHYLNGEKASVNETAYLVGFSDPSSFSRAFKRWTGHSPGQSRTLEAQD